MSSIIKLVIDLFISTIEDAVEQFGQDVLERFSLFMSKLLYLVWIFFLFGVSVLFLFVSGAMYLGEYLHSYPLGFLSASGISLLLIGALILRSRKGHGFYRFIMSFFSVVFAKYKAPK